MKVQNRATGKVLPALPLNVGRYYRLQAFIGMHGLFLAALPSLWMDAEMSLHDVARLEVWYSVLAIPLLSVGGAVADLKGRRIGMVIGLAMLACGEAAYAATSQQWQMWVAELLLACGWSLYPSAVTAMLGDSLADEGLSNLFEQVRAKGASIVMAMTAVAMVTGGYLADSSPRTPIAISMVCMAGATAFALRFAEPSKRTIASEAGVCERMRILARMVKNQFAADRELQKLAILNAMLGVSGLASFLFLQSYCRENQLGACCFGMVTASSSVFAAVLSKQIPAIEERIGYGKTKALAITSVVLPLVIAGFFASRFCVSLFVMQAFGRAFSDVALSAKINARTRREDRASLNALVQIGFRVFALILCTLLCFVPLSFGAHGFYLISAAAVFVVFFLEKLALKPVSREDNIEVLPGY